MNVDRTDQIWEYRDTHDRFVIAWLHEPVDTMYHAVTVFFSADERLWGLGPQNWAESSLEPWDENRAFTRLF